MMLDSIRALLGKKTADADALGGARNGIDLAALSSAVENLEAERRAALLESDDATIAKIEERLAKARRDLDRGHAAIEELDRRIAAAMKKEALAKWRGERSLRDANASAAARSLRERYSALARAIVELVAEAKSADLAIRDWNNNRLNNAPDGAGEDDTQPLDPVEARIFVNYHQDGVNGSLINGIRLPLIDPTFAPGLHDHGAELRGFPMKLKAA